MPVTCIRVDGSEKGWFVFEFTEDTNYQQFACFINKLVCNESEAHQLVQKSDIKSILSLAQSDRERNLLRYSLFRASGTSFTAAKKKFGFEDMPSIVMSVEDAMKESSNIREAVEDVVHIQNQALLASLGVKSSSDECSGSDDADNVQEMDPDSWKKLLLKRQKSIKRRGQRLKAKLIAERRFLSRKVSSIKANSILQQYPDIGKEIERFVSDRNVGADAWRRTGVLTFDGNQKIINEKVTYERIRRHLETKYNRKFSYGTVVQFCIPRNRRRSAKNYKSVAKVTTRRARKGFSLKYNPDSHWSASFYKGLNWLEYTDPSDILNINRDDASGFRLDTLSTHSQHPCPMVQGKSVLTTRTDYVNRYPSTLQTTSYNFAETPGHTPELCAGIVKASKIYPKNPAQHYADLQMLQNSDEFKIGFLNPKSGMKKKIACIRVDGGGDEGPSHVEVQYFWTAFHLEQGFTATLVTTRSSGSSYLNRVELQNGCLSLAHANLFIPSTIHGTVHTEDDENRNEKLIRNLDAAIDVYIDHCNYAPCGDAKIILFKGADSSCYQDKRQDLLTFLKSSKGREKLKIEKPELYCEFERVWSVRHEHLVRNLPSQYVFYLLPCYLDTCPHPVCQTGKPISEPTWFENGPPISYLPFPVPSYKECNACTVCYGHYTSPEEAFKDHLSVSSQPPSQVIYTVFKQSSRTEKSSTVCSAIDNLSSKKLLLPPENVLMWLDHLASIAVNRRRGAAKAAESRRKKKSKKQREIEENVIEENIIEENVVEENVIEENVGEENVIEENVVEENVIEENVVEENVIEENVCENENVETKCGVCNEEYEEKTVEEEVWIQCDSCLLWFHTHCVSIKPDAIPDTFLCGSC